MAAYAFLVFVAPVSPDIVAPPVPQDDRSVRMISPAADDAALSMTSMLTGASAVSESAAADTSVVADTEAISADVAVPEPALERPASRPQSGGGSDPVSTPAAEPVSNSVRNSVSDTASTSQRVVAPESTQPSRPLAADKAMTAPISDDAFSLSDIFSPIPTESASSSSIMADSVPVSSSAVAPDPANYTVEISS